MYARPIQTIHTPRVLLEIDRVPWAPQTTGTSYYHCGSTRTRPGPANQIWGKTPVQHQLRSQLGIERGWVRSTPGGKRSSRTQSRALPHREWNGTALVERASGRAAGPERKQSCQSGVDPINPRDGGPSGAGSLSGLLLPHFLLFTMLPLRPARRSPRYSRARAPPRTNRVFGCGTIMMGWFHPSFWDGADPFLVWFHL